MSSSRTRKKLCVKVLTLFLLLELLEPGVALVSRPPQQKNIASLILSNEVELEEEEENNKLTTSEIVQVKDTKLADMVIPIVINTWAFTEANNRAWDLLARGSSALDAVEVGAAACEELQCDYTVGFGGSPDENGETTLDAMIMDGETHAVGAVGCLRRVKNAVGVARKIMEHTRHTLLVGELATDFAVKMGFKEENLTTNVSAKMNADWKLANCQPNFWRNVIPDPSSSCGPYSIPSIAHSQVSDHSQQPESSKVIIDRFNHDTIGMVAIDSLGRIASATSSNGARNKIPGRVGDAPITGAGSYVERDIGGASATGDGDIMARFLPSLIAVEQMGNGMKPQDAAAVAISRIFKYYPTFSGALVAVNLKGEFGAACHGISNGFPYCVTHAGNNNLTVYTARCT